MRHWLMLAGFVELMIAVVAIVRAFS